MQLTEAPELIAQAEEAADYLADIDEAVHVIAHYDCDGICSGTIIHEALTRADIPFTLTFVDELNAANLKEIRFDADEDVFLLVDIGSGQLDAVEEVLGDLDVIIADHHEPQNGDVRHHINPHLTGIDGGDMISGAGVTYLLADAVLEDATDLLKYALIGATGDIQKDGDEYTGLNQDLMAQALDAGLIEKKQGLKLYGRSRKSVKDALQYTTDPYLPGISNSESGAVQFLSRLDIPLRDNGDWRTLEDMTLEEERTIINQLLMRGYDVGGLIGTIYILDNGWEIGEYSSLMNACGRMDRPNDGITVNLEKDWDLANTIKRSYGRKISRYLSLVEDEPETLIEEYACGKLINAGSRIHANMIGTVTTICQKSGILDGDILVGIAEKDPDFIKISARAASHVVENGLKMNDTLSEICEACGGEGGGHDAAAGGKIPRSEQGRFIKMIEKVLTTKDIEVVQHG